jgi:hypothetical protein
MKKLALVAAAVALSSGAAFADKASAPGQDRACLVTTSGGASGAITDTKWLPRKAAEKQADNDTTFVGTNPIVATKQGCQSLDPS